MSSSPTTGSGSREGLDQATDRQLRKSFDFDSGCQGSDRSAKNPARIIKSPTAATSGPGSRLRLSNVDEREEKVEVVSGSGYEKSPAVTDRSRKSFEFAEKIDSSGRGRFRETFHSVTDLSSDERSIAVASAKSSPRRRCSEKATPPSSSRTSRGATAILASQIDQEILELRSFYEQHRNEMLSLAATSVAPIKPTAAVVHCVDTQTSTKSPVKVQRQFVSRQPAKYLESESDSVMDGSLQEERRLEFQQRRLRQLQKKRMTQNDADRVRRDAHLGEVRSVEKSRFEVYPATNFAIGLPSTPQASKSQAISSFFPPVCSTDNKVRRHSSTDASIAGRPDSSHDVRRCHDVVDGRHLAAVDGDEIFIPKLDLDELVSVTNNFLIYGFFS